ncbi:MAG: CPBP family intramembrane metalloprotease [Clostridiaceae bacterium]|nr:CPBP family intramembrane metalloprotease [Clostridiaceae bacterium]
MNINAQVQKNKRKHMNPFLFLMILAYSVSFIFAKESKAELAVLLFMTLILVFVMGVIKKDKEPGNLSMNNSTELKVFLGYFVLYMIWSLFNIFYGLVQSDFINVFLLFIIPYIITKFFGHNFISSGLDFKEFVVNFPKTLLLCVIISAFLIPVVFIKYLEQKSINFLTGGLSFIFVFVLVFIFNAIPEEFFFRGILQSRLERIIKSPVTTVLLSSVIFALYHVPYRLLLWTSPTFHNMPATIFSVICQQFLLGAFFGMWWLKTRNIFSTAFIHSFYNAFFLLEVIKFGTN